MFQDFQPEITDSDQARRSASMRKEDGRSNMGLLKLKQRAENFWILVVLPGKDNDLILVKETTKGTLMVRVLWRAREALAICRGRHSVNLTTATSCRCALSRFRIVVMKTKELGMMGGRTQTQKNHQIGCQQSNCEFACQHYWL